MLAGRLAGQSAKEDKSPAVGTIERLPILYSIYSPDLAAKPSLSIPPKPSRRFANILHNLSFCLDGLAVIAYFLISASLCSRLLGFVVTYETAAE